MFMIMEMRRRLASGSANKTLFPNSSRRARTSRTPVPRLHIPLAQNHGSSFRPSSIFSQEGWSPARFSLADSNIHLVKLLSRRGISGHDSCGARVSILEAGVGTTRSGVVIPFLKLRHPRTTLRHAGRMRCWRVFFPLPALDS